MNIKALNFTVSTSSSSTYVGKFYLYLVNSAGLNQDDLLAEMENNTKIGVVNFQQSDNVTNGIPINIQDISIEYFPKVQRPASDGANYLYLVICQFDIVTYSSSFNPVMNNGLFSFVYNNISYTV